MSISSTPWGEECAQLGKPGYFERAQAECRAFRDQLLREYKAAHEGAEPPCRLIVKGNPHDFGTYYDVTAVYSEEDEASIEAALWFENNSPELWDTEARLVLELPQVD